MILGSAKEARNSKAGWAEYMRKYRKARPEVIRKIDIKKKFGLEYDEYLKMLDKQNGVCAICGQPETMVDYRTKKVINLAIDHCHKTGKIRGLLCTSCNKALGGFQDSIEFLEKAIQYLKQVHNR